MEVVVGVGDALFLHGAFLFSLALSFSFPLFFLFVGLVHIYLGICSGGRFRLVGEVGTRGRAGYLFVALHQVADEEDCSLVLLLAVPFWCCAGAFTYRIR